VKTPLSTSSTVLSNSEAGRMLQVIGVVKSFPGVLAVDGADLTIAAGEVLALVGENGAGKSTLIKVITGAHQPDSGRVELAGREITGCGPVASAGAGVACIYQELNLVPQLTVRENLFLGREKGRLGLIDIAMEQQLARDVLSRLQADINPEAIAGELDVANQQLVEIGRALLAEARLLIMDEPTAALAPREVKQLFIVLAELRQQGMSILFISHRLDEVFEIANRVTVMRDGHTLGCWLVDDLDRSELIELMVGRPLDQEFPKQPAAIGNVLLAANNICGGRVRDVSFEVRAGEVLGLDGYRRRELSP